MRVCLQPAVAQRKTEWRPRVIACLLVAAAALLAATARGQTFSTPINISSAVGGGLPLIAVDSAGNIDIAWAGAAPARGVFFTRSTDNGKDFATPTTVAPSSSGGEKLQMAVDQSGAIYLFWQESNQHYVLSRSTNGGASFSAPTDLSTTLGLGTLTANLPTLAIDPTNNVDLIWPQFGSTGSILFSRSTDGGATFSSPVTVGTFGYAAGAQIGFDASGNIDVLWFEETTTQGGTCLLRFSRSTNSGASFSAMQTLNSADGECTPQLFVDSSANINIASFNGNGTYYRSTNGGQGFATTAGAFQPVVAGFGGQMYANAAGAIELLVNGFLPPNGPEHDLFFNRSSDSGSVFSAPIMIGGLHPPSTSPEEIGASGQSMAVDGGGNVNVLWADDTFSTQPGVADIFFSRSADGGATFSKPQNLSNSTAVSSAPQMALDSAGNINVVWASSDASNVFYSRGAVSQAASGFTISATPASLTALPGGSAAAQVTLTAAGSFDQSVSMACNNLPAGAGCSFDPSSATPTSSGAIVTLTLTIPPTLPAGGFPFTITAANPFVTESQSVEATVGAMTGSVTPAAATIPVGSAAVFTVTMTGASGVAGQFALGCSSPVAVSCTFSPGSLAVNGAASSTLTVQVSNAPVTGMAPAGPADIFPPSLPLGRFVAFAASQDAPLIAGFALLVLGTLTWALERGRQDGVWRIPRRAVSRAAGMATALALAATMISCGGATSKSVTGGGTTGTSSPNAPAGSNSVTFPMTVTAQSGTSVVNLGTITVTVP